jgi:ATP adenylyltransferase
MEQNADSLKRGTLWPTLLERTANARRCGAIRPIATLMDVIEQDTIAFHIRIVTAAARKPEDKAPQPGTNPFLPYDPDLFVADISPTHIALLNKFNVVNHHLLIVTRSFEPQETLLTRGDCAALLTCLAEFEGLGFYNAGPIAGASQPHKHLQLIPFSDSARLPIEPLLHSARMAGPTGTVPGLPFLHAYAPVDHAWISRPDGGSASLLAAYHALLTAVGLSADPVENGGSIVPPYNLLVTREWLLMVPRSRERFEGIPINSLGFAGAMLVRNEGELSILRRCGPMTALRHVTFPPRSGSATG